MTDKSFEEIAKDQVGTIYHDEYKDGVRFVILRGPHSLCAYVGIPKNHPLAEHEYDNIPIRCHGGLTFGGELNYLDKNLCWYGWDYGHCGDQSFCDKEKFADETAWTVEMVYKDSWESLYDMGKLMKLAEEIYTRTKWGKE